MRAVILCLLSLAACDSILGIKDVSRGDRSGDGGIDAGPSTVNGTAMDIYNASPTEAMMVPADLSAYVIDAYAPDSSESGFKVIHGMGRKDGTFTIPDVPAGSYYLFLTSPDLTLPHFYETSSRSPEIGQTRFGRIDGPVATASTELTLRLSEMTPLAETDSISINSFSTGVSVTAFVGSPGLVVGATALERTLDWASLGKPLLTAARGDDLYVSHARRETPVPNVLIFTILDAFSARDVTLTNGQPAIVTDSFAPLTLSGTLQYFVDAASFVDGLDLPNHMPVNLDANLQATSNNQGQVVRLNGQFDPGAGVSSFRVPYLDPYPVDWPRIHRTGVSLDWWFAARGTTHHVAYTSNATASRTATTTTTSQFDVQRGVAPPHAIKIGGVDTSRAVAVPFDGTHAVPIEWAPVSGVSHYIVVGLHVSDLGSRADVTVGFFLETTRNNALLPASLFKLGDAYVVSVVSTVDAHGYADGALRRSFLGTAHHEAVSARLLFATSCGNGVRDASYEECDASGAATADCNADCTLPRCGDGITNTAANEICDDVVDSLVCDDDCSLPACGDGHVNTVVGEGCDDHGNIPGDGCSSTCTVEPGFTCTGSPSLCRHI